MCHLCTVHYFVLYSFMPCLHAKSELLSALAVSSVLPSCRPPPPPPGDKVAVMPNLLQLPLKGLLKTHFCHGSSKEFDNW